MKRCLLDMTDHYLMTSEQLCLPEPDQASQHSNRSWGGIQEAPPPAEKQSAFDGCGVRKGQFS